MARSKLNFTEQVAGASAAGVNTFNARAGAVTLVIADVLAALGFTPVQQGTGAGQAANIVKLGWDGGGHLKGTIDSTDLGAIWTDYNAGSGSGWKKLPNGLILQFGSSVVTTNASGLATITYPVSFPASAVPVVSNGDASVTAQPVHVYSSSLSSFVAYVPAFSNSNCRVNWHALGT